MAIERLKYRVLVAPDGGIAGYTEVVVGQFIFLSASEALYELDLGYIQLATDTPPPPVAPILPSDGLRALRGGLERSITVEDLKEEIVGDVLERTATVEASATAATAAAGVVVARASEVSAAATAALGNADRAAAKAEEARQARAQTSLDLLAFRSEAADVLVQVRAVYGATQRAGHTPVDDVDYAATAADAQIGYATLTAPRTLTLPDVDIYPVGQVLFIADESGQCGVGREITIRVGATTGDTIAGQTAIQLSDPYQGLGFRRGAANVWIIAR